MGDTAFGNESFKESAARVITEDELRSLDAIAKQLIRRYAMLAAASGAATAVPSAIPAVGQLVAIGGGAAVDMAASLKIQMDLAQCLIVLYHPTMSSAEQRELAALLGLGGALAAKVEKGAAAAAPKVAAKLLENYLRGAALATVKQLFKRIGITFTRAALIRALPVVAIPISGASNYALTLFTGRVARSAARPVLGKSDAAGAPK